MVAQEYIEVIGLEQHVVELEKAEAALEPGLHGLGRKHPVHAEVAADVAQEFDVVQRGQPRGIVEHDGLALVEGEVAGELPFQVLGICPDLLLGEQLSHLGLAARVAHHGCAAADDDYGAVPCALHVCQRHDRHQASHVKAGCGRVEADVAGDRAGLEQLVDPFFIRDLINEAAFFEHDIGVIYVVHLLYPFRVAMRLF